MHIADIKKIINENSLVTESIFEVCAKNIKDLGDVRICIPSNNTQRIQEGHLLVEHMLCKLF